MITDRIELAKTITESISQETKLKKLGSNINVYWHESKTKNLISLIKENRLNNKKISTFRGGRVSPSLNSSLNSWLNFNPLVAI